MDELTNGDSDTPTPSDDDSTTQDKIGYRSAFGCMAVPLIGWSALCTFLFWSPTNPVGSILIGVVLAPIIFFIAAQVISSGATTLMELTIGGCISLALAIVLVPVFLEAKEKARQKSCLTNVKSISAALQMYAADYDDRLPPGPNWMTATNMYFGGKSDDRSLINGVFHCPSSPSSFGYAFNTTASVAERKSVRNSARLPLIFDSAPGTRNASDTLTSLPKPGRHRKGNIIGYADGHARWVKDGVTP